MENQIETRRLSLFRDLGFMVSGLEGFQVSVSGS